MRIAINAADLDRSRIDGTRVYIQNILKNLGPASRERRDHFLIYHQNSFNPELDFPVSGNYSIIKLPFPFYWTQMRFAFEMWRTKPDALWMPMHSLPYLRSRKTKTVVTIHDLAFKFFPQFFPKKDLRRLNFFTNYAVRNADRLIAVSNATKKDLLKVYPFLDEEKIKVIYHGYDKNLFKADVSRDQIQKKKMKYHIPYDKYFIFLGAIQPRKNISTLIDAFQLLRKDVRYQDLGLVVAGEPGWMYGEVMQKMAKSENVSATGKIDPEDKADLLAGSVALIFPSFYEGFGLPALEAMACGTPVVAANTSSLAEIIGEAGILFDPYSRESLVAALRKILESDMLQKNLKQKGLEAVKDFDWEKCSRETLAWLKK